MIHPMDKDLKMHFFIDQHDFEQTKFLIMKREGITVKLLQMC